MQSTAISLATLALAGALAAQGQDSTHPTPRPATVTPVVPGVAMTTPADEVLVDDTAPGVLWAAAPTWKASFAADGTTFVPCFGSSAPRNFPARLARATVRVGELALRPGDGMPSRAGDTVAYVGRTFTERYVLSQTGIEQQFVLAELPNRGPIAIDVPFSTELDVSATADGFRMSNEHGSFGYGRAVAIDGKGDRCELATERTAAGFRILVPGAFVAAAALPLVIDPLVGAVTTVVTDTRATVSTEIAWHEGMQRYCVVWERFFSATDSDVFARYLDGSMQMVGTQQTIDVSTDSWRAPRIASVGSLDQFVVVAQKSTGNVAPFTAQSRFVYGATPATSAPQALFAPGVEVYALDVGGDPSPTNARFCIVAETSSGGSSHDIAAELRSASGGLLASAYIDNSPALELTPQVSKSCGMPGGGTQGWGIAWLRRTTPSQNQPLFSCVSRDLVPTANAAPTPFLTAANQNRIAVSSPTDHEQGRQYMVLTSYDSGGWDAARGGLFSRTGTFVVPTGLWSGSWPGSGEPQVDSDGTRFLATFEQTGSATQHVVNFVLCGNDGAWLDSQHWTNGNTPNDTSACVVARRSGGGPDRAYGLAWVENLSPSGSRVVASAFDGIQDGAQFGVRYTSCGSLGFLSGGSPVLGDSVDLMMASNTGLVGWIVGLPVDLPIGICPGCRQGVDGAVVLGPTYSFAVPRNPAFVGLTLAFQGFQFLPTAGGGACLSQVNLTNTLDATIR